MWLVSQWELVSSNPSICPIDPGWAAGSWRKEWRRKANTGHKSMDLQWLLVCSGEKTQDTPPLWSADKRSLFSVSLRGWRNPCRVREGESVYISSPLVLHLIQRREAMESTAQEQKREHFNESILRSTKRWITWVISCAGWAKTISTTELLSFKPLTFQNPVFNWGNLSKCIWGACKICNSPSVAC